MYYLPGSIAEAAHKWQMAEERETVSREDHRIAKEKLKKAHHSFVEAKHNYDVGCRSVQKLLDIVERRAKETAAAAENWAEIKAAKEAK